MARVTYTRYFGEHGELEEIYNIDRLEISSSARTRVEYVDNTGDSIVFDGVRLNVEGGEMVAGRVSAFRFVDDGGERLINVGNGNWSAAELSGGLFGGSGIRGLLIEAYAGNDRFFGSRNGDILYGAGGQDTLRGGKGEDWFLFGHGDGRDVVLDFDANGGEGKQDFIRQFSNDFEIRRDGENTVIDFGGGDTLTLLDVRRSQISSADFMPFEF